LCLPRKSEKRRKQEKKNDSMSPECVSLWRFVALTMFLKFEIRSTKLETNPNDPNSNDKNREIIGFRFEHFNF
jgi:hypothetical protein